MDFYDAISFTELDQKKSKTDLGFLFEKGFFLA